MRRSHLIGVVALTFIVSACSGSRSRLKIGESVEGEVVEAEGYAPHDPKDMIATKRASLVDAQRNAIEKAVGVFVSGRTLVEKAIAIENNILARTEGYIKKYDVLSEAPENGLYKTRIRALVALKDLEADLREMALLKQPDLKRPRVTVSITEEIDGEQIWEKVAERQLEKKLIEQGFVVVSEDRAGEADLRIKGKASSHPFQATGLGGFVSYRARMSLQATRPGTSDVLASSSHEASGLGGSKQLAGYKSLEAVADVSGAEVAAALTQAWSTNKTVLVFVEGTKSFADVERIRKHLSAQPNVADLMLRMYDEGMAQFEVQMGSGHATELAAGLEASQVLPLKVQDVKPQSLRLKVE